MAGTGHDGCWACGSQSLSGRHDAAGGDACTQKITLSADKGSHSLVATLVAHLCAELGGLNVVVHDAVDKATEVEVSSDGRNEKHEGVVAGCRALIFASASHLMADLLGCSPESSEEILRWLESPSDCLDRLPAPSANPKSSTTTTSSSGDSELPLPRLAALNSFLSHRAVLVGRSARASLADIAVFTLVHSDVASLTPEVNAQLPHLLRWIDLIQATVDFKAVFPRITIAKPSFDPPPPLPPVVKTAPPGEGKKEGDGAKEGKEKEKGKDKGKEDAKDKEVGKAKGKGDGKEKEKGGKEKGEKEEPSGGEKKAEAAKTSIEPAVTSTGLPPPDVNVSVLDIRVGRINKVWKHPNADALYVEEIDLGEAAPRQVVSGLAKFLTEEEMTNRRVVVLCNVKPGKVRDVVSSGLVLCASNADHSVCHPIAPPEGASIGEKVSFQGYDGKPEEVLNPKKKAFDKIQPFLKTDASGIAMFGATPFSTSAGPCTSDIVDAAIK